jgi:hypothetical protein
MSYSSPGCNEQEAGMNLQEFKSSVAQQVPPAGLSVPLAALWWDAKGDWAQAHTLVDELETNDGMAVHAYLHRKDGLAANTTSQTLQKSGKRWLRRC